MERIFDGVIKSNAGHRLYARIIRQARPYWLHLVGLFLLSMLASPISLLVPLPLKITVDSAIANHPLPSFLAAAREHG
jgi:ATP-binding cassette, subfamily B, bacterial